MSDFGKLSHLVKLCTLTPRHARIAIHGGGGSGKTYGALQLARGLLGPGGRIVLVSLGENRAEELYAGVCEFWHVDASHPDVVKAAQAAYPAQRGGLPWEGEGADPRAVLYVLRQVAAGAGLGGVLIIDSMSEVWDGIKGRVDTFTGGVEAKNRFAWAAVAPVSSALWDAIETAPCHTIITVRAKTTVHMEPRGKGQVPVHVPTDPELRNRDEFRMDVRIFVDSEHRARFAGRLTAVNESTVDLLTPDIGARLKVLLGGDPAGHHGSTVARVQHPLERPAIAEPFDDAEVDEPAETPGDNRPLPPEVAPWDVWWAYDTAQGKDPDELKTLVPKHARNRAEKLNRFLGFMRNGQGKSIGRPGILNLAERTAEDVPTATIETMLARLEVSQWSELGGDHLAGFVAALLRERERVTAAKKG